MEPKIIRKGAFTVVGIDAMVSAKTLQSDIAKIWGAAAELDLDNVIQHRVDMNLSLAFIRNWSDIDPLSYFLGAEVTDLENLPQGCISQSIADSTYAVFDMLGSGSGLTEPWPEIYNWFESSEHEWVVPMNFREYDDATQGGRLFIPISINE